MTWKPLESTGPSQGVAMEADLPANLSIQQPSPGGGHPAPPQHLPCPCAQAFTSPGAPSGRKPLRGD